jgi:transcriptional regulator with XRE-family HTH domain
MTAESDVQRILSLLRRAIRSSGFSQKEVDRRIGVQPGYLSQVMIGRLDLKLKHLLRALDAIEVEASAFFDLAFTGQRGAEPTGADLLSLLPAGATGAPASSTAGSLHPSLNPDELEALIARTVREEIRQRESGDRLGARARQR